MRERYHLVTTVTLRWSHVAREFVCNTALIRYDAARKAIAAAHRVDEVKAIRDKAKRYASTPNRRAISNCRTKQPKSGYAPSGVPGNCCSIWRRTPEQGAKGDLVRMEPNLRGRAEQPPTPPKLEDIGITKDQSSKWQRLIVAVPSESTIRRTVDDTRGCERQTANPRDGGAGFS